ncbi:unnamed protein product [Sympodiomycopsis kandeliae]
MPLKLKLAARQQRPAATSPTEATEADTQDTPTHSRSVSFHSPSTTTSTSIPIRRPTVTKQDPNDNDDGASQTGHDLSSRPTKRPRTDTPQSPSISRPRSPTPQSEATTHCLPIPSKQKQSSSTDITSEDISHALRLTILRYVSLSGYTAIEGGVLDVLMRYLHYYMKELAEYSQDCAITAGRAWPNGRDLLQAISQQHISTQDTNDKDKKEEGEEHKLKSKQDGQHHPFGSSVRSLIAWRHTIPDYHDEYSTRNQCLFAQQQQPTWSTLPEVILPEPTSQSQSDSTQDLVLLSRKSRMKEKISRVEIPPHLPDLPALHTWKQTEAFPSNKMLQQQQQQQQQQQHDGDDKTSTSTTGGNTLSRLESRLTSSRLVQGSLGSLIGRLGSSANQQPSTAASSPPPPPAAAATEAQSRDMPSSHKRLSIRIKDKSTDSPHSPSLASSRRPTLPGTPSSVTTPWRNPIMSPLVTSTPKTANNYSGAWPFFQAAAGSNDLSQGMDSVVMGGADSIDDSRSIGMGMASAAMPSVVNFKAAWYARR